MENTTMISEQLANHFVSYLFKKYKGSSHVRRVASWIGFLMLGVEKIATSSLRLNRQRQIMFEYKCHQFKAKFNHETGFKGGIDIIEVLPERGAPEGRTVFQIKNLADAEDCYLSLKARLDSFIK